MKRATIGLIFFSLAAFSSSASDSFFKIHQATGFFEQFIASRCPHGKKKAEQLLKAMDRNKTDVSLNEKALELSSLLDKGNPPTVTEVESFRLALHELMERKHFYHEARWHDQIVDECKVAKH